MAIMPGADRSQTFRGNSYREKVDKIVLHTTEGSSWPGYNGGRNAPHFTVKPRVGIRQHIDTQYAAKALVNRAGGVQTNNDGAIQIEYIGSCDRSYAKKHNLFFVPDADDDDLAELAAVIRWASERYGIPLTDRGLTWSDTNAAYRNAPQRMSFAEWERFTGVCGHQHVPENTHWDPGKLPVGRLLELAGGAKASASAARDPWETSNTIAEMSASAVKALQQDLVALGHDIKVDGKYGKNTYAAVVAAQKALKVTADGVAGSVTLAAISAKRAGESIEDAVEAVKPKSPKAPSFPLPRGFYYGPRTGPQKSVSGHVRNSATDDVVLYAGDYHSKGLRLWQKRMQERGYKLAADGLYGPVTGAAAKNLQRIGGITQDGLIGDATWPLAWSEPIR